MLTMQDASARLLAYWSEQGCRHLRPGTEPQVPGPHPGREVHAGPAAQPEVRVVLQPEPGNAQELYLGSLASLGIDVAAHDVRFVEDGQDPPEPGTWGLGWEVRLDGLGITRFSYLQQAGGRTLDVPACEITYRVERIAAALQRVSHLRDTDVAGPWTDPRAQPGHPPAVLPPAGGDRPRTLVLEIGTEEMPPAEARYAREQVRRALTDRLAATGLGHGEIRVHSTPRRLVAVVAEVAAGQVPGGAAPAALAEVLAAVVAGLRSGRTMRWNDPHLTFTRPIRWLVALWGDQVLPVRVSTLAAGRETRLPRTATPPVVAVASAETFMETIAVHGVVADPEDRRDLIVAGAEDLVYPDGRIDVAAESGLIDRIADLVEQPVPLLATFDERHLDLPEAVLTTELCERRHYLPVRDAAGALLPMVVVVADGTVDVGLVRAGTEAVLGACLADAAAPRSTAGPAGSG